MVDDGNLGVELIQRGWCQSSVIKPPAPVSTSWLTLASTELEEIWIKKEAFLSEDDMLIVISQACDIQKSPSQEPYIETIRLYWTSDKAIINSASKNSASEFLVTRGCSEDGIAGGWIADMHGLVRLDKRSFLKMTPFPFFNEEEDPGRRKLFGIWLAKRYNRQAVPNEIVKAVQQPVVSAASKLGPNHDLHRIFRGIWQIRFIAYLNGSSLYDVEMYLLYDEASTEQVNKEDAAKLAGWIKGVLDKSGNAELTSCARISLKEISVHDYANMYQLPVDYFTLPELLQEKMDT
jgi:hypothetical protein